MLVHFIGSNRSIKDDIGYFRRIIKSIHSKGHIISRDWVEAAYETTLDKSSFDYSDLDWNTIYSENIGALTKADIVIVEATTKSFAVGFQTAIALQQKKPTLLLSRDPISDQTFISGVQETLLEFRQYGEDNLEEIVDKFIEDNTIENKDMRFNFFIDRQIYNYLKWASLKTRKTKAEILRELVVREIDKQKETL